MDTVKDVLGRWGRKVAEATRKAEDLAGNTWQHLKTSPSFAEAAMGRIAQGTKVLAEGGYEKIFRQTFETVVIPLHQLKAIIPSTSRVNPSEKYIQVSSVDSHEFWFMGFLNYESAVKCLQEALQQHSLQSV
ncbi:hypothetical protein Goklo_027799 [Gossypium klotzschianum]|uniref:GRAM domain-containing protein n=1 Tax=Gossypium klotzschianum TaxID=34286 RepID=A0A7J8TZ92_9ROSI|nr:hypothetical protein [Gossypium klotzschianum]